MMREWRRVLFGSKALLILVAFLVIAGYQIYNSLHSDSNQEKQLVYYQEAVKEVKAVNSEERADYVREVLAQLKKEEDASLENGGYFENWDKKMAFQMVQEQLNYQKSYPEYLEKIQSDASRIMKGGPFGTPTGYSANNAKKTAADFEGLSETMMSFGAAYGIGQLWELDLTGYLAAVFVLCLVMQIRRQYRRGLWDMIYAAPGGRRAMVWNQVVLLFTGSVLGAGNLYLVRVLVTLSVYGGWDCLKFTAQSIDIFQKCTFSVTVWQALLLSGLWHILATFVTAIFVWGIFTIIGNDKLAMALLVAVCLAEYALYAGISASSNLILLKDLNLFNLWNSQNFLISYQNYNFFDMAVGQYPVILGFLTILLFVFGTAAAVLNCCKHPKNASSLPERILDMIRRKALPLIGRVPAFFKEYYKVLIYQRGWLVLLVWIYLAVTNYSGTLSLYSERVDIIVDRVYTQTQGQTLAEAQTYLDSMVAENDSGLTEMAEAAEGYAAGKVSYDTYMAISEKYRYNGYRQQAYSQVQEEIERLKKMEAAPAAAKKTLQLVNPYGWASISRPLKLWDAADYYRYNRRKLWNLYQLAILIFLFAALFPFEKKTKMNKLLCSASGGRGKLRRRKKRTAVLSVFLMSAAADVLLCQQIMRSGGLLQCLTQPAASLSWFAEIPVWIPIWAVIGGIFLLRLMMTAAFIGILLFISARSKSQTMAIVISVAVLLLPACIEYLTGVSFLPLSVMEGLQIIYDKGMTGVIILVGYGVVGFTACLTAGCNNYK